MVLMRVANRSTAISLAVSCPFFKRVPLCEAGSTIRKRARKPWPDASGSASKGRGMAGVECAKSIASASKMTGSQSPINHLESENQRSARRGGDSILCMLGTRLSSRST